MLNCPIIIAKQQRSISHFGLAPINHFHKFSNCKKSKFQISVEGGVGVKKKARSGTDQYSDFRLDPDPRDFNTLILISGTEVVFLLQHVGTYEYL